MNRLKDRRLLWGLAAGAMFLAACGLWKARRPAPAPAGPAETAAGAADETAAKAGDKALAAFKRGDAKKAREAVDRWLAAAPRDPYARMLSCVLYERARQFAAAVKDCELTVSLKPPRPDVTLDALCAAASAEQGLGHPQAASAGWRKALAMAPADWRRRTEIARRLAEVGKGGG